MKPVNDIMREMEQLSPTIAAIGNGNVYAVPSGYFDNFTETVLAQLNAEQILYKNISTPFAIPAGYFEGFAANLITKIKAQENKDLGELDELSSIAPLLNTISKENVYTVPANYFQNFVPLINAQTAAPARVVKMQHSRRWFMYAAAVITGLLAVGAFLFENKNTKSNIIIEKVNAYAQFSKMNISENISKLSDAELASYLSQPAADYEDDDSTEIVPVGNDTNMVQDFITTSSDEELQQYLKENKSPGDKELKGI